jgi:hypothetical protein
MPAEAFRSSGTRREEDFALIIADSISEEKFQPEDEWREGEGG